MDSIAREIWEAKLAQKRYQRNEGYEICMNDLNAKGLLHSGSVPQFLFKVASENLANLALQWREIFQEYWTREKPQDSADIAKEAITIIVKFFEDELAHIHSEITNINKRRKFNWEESTIADGKKELNQTFAVIKPKCIALVKKLCADTERQRTYERQEKRRKLLETLLSLVVGGCVALFSVWLTNRWNRANLEPLVELVISEQNNLGIIKINNDTLHLLVSNIGPMNVEDVQVYVETFHASSDLGKIRLDELYAKPTFAIDRMKEGDARQFTFGSDDRFVWASIFKNEGNIYRKNRKFKGMLLFLKLHAKYRRAIDKRLFTTTRIYHATRTSLVPWNFPQSNEDFFSGQNR